MKTLSERMNMKFGEYDGAHVMRNVNLGFVGYDTLCVICHELSEDVSDVAESDFDSSSIILENFVNCANDETGYTVSVWFD